MRIYKIERGMSLDENGVLPLPVINDNQLIYVISTQEKRKKRRGLMPLLLWTLKYIVSPALECAVFYYILLA